MTASDGFLYVHTDIPAGMNIREWRAGPRQPTRGSPGGEGTSMAVADCAHGADVRACRREVQRATSGGGRPADRP